MPSRRVALTADTCHHALTCWSSLTAWSRLSRRRLPRVGARTRTSAIASRGGIASGMPLDTGSLQQHAFAQPALGDLERGAELLRSGLEDQQTGGKQAHPFDLEREPPRDRRCALAGEQ